MRSNYRGYKSTARLRLERENPRTTSSTRNGKSLQPHPVYWVSERGQTFKNKCLPLIFRSRIHQKACSATKWFALCPGMAAFTCVTMWINWPSGRVTGWAKTPICSAKYPCKTGGEFRIYFFSELQTTSSLGRSMLWLSDFECLTV